MNKWLLYCIGIGFTTASFVVAALSVSVAEGACRR